MLRWARFIHETALRKFVKLLDLLTKHAGAIQPSGSALSFWYGGCHQQPASSRSDRLFRGANQHREKLCGAFVSAVQ